MILEINNLSKKYGDKKALNKFSCKFTEGIYGLLGPNGAGKSTLMNILVDAIDRSSGEILYNGKETISMGKDYRNLIGYMPQQQGVYDSFTVAEFLDYIAGLKGLKKTEAKKRIEEVLKFVNLYDVKNKKLKSFSGGMKQRALIAQAILNDPKILILDEPTAGLDPKERIRIRNLISQIGFNKIVIIATHVVSDIEFIAKEVLILDNGILRKKDTPENLLKGIEDVVYEAEINEQDVNSIMNKYTVTSLSKEYAKIRVRFLFDGIPDVDNAKKASPTLEDLYLHIFGDR